MTLADVLVHRSVWIVGGDGWAYDIGFGGLDHVLTTGATSISWCWTRACIPTRAARPRRRRRGPRSPSLPPTAKPGRKKDLGMLAVSYGNVYVAQIAMGANPTQTLKAFREAESYHGPSLILAYSQCIAHGINMTHGMTHQKEVVQSGLWPLFRYDPRLAHAGEHPFHLDSRKPTMPFADFAPLEARFAMTLRSNPEHAERLVGLAQKDIDDRWHYYEQMAGVERAIAAENGELPTCVPT